MLEDLRIRQVGAGLALPSAVALRLGDQGDPWWSHRQISREIHLFEKMSSRGICQIQRKEKYLGEIGEIRNIDSFWQSTGKSQWDMDLMEGGGHRCPRSRKTAGNVRFAGSSAWSSGCQVTPLFGSTNVNHVQPLNPPFWRLEILHGWIGLQLSI